MRRSCNPLDRTAVPRSSQAWVSMRVVWRKPAFGAMCMVAALAAFSAAAQAKELLFQQVRELAPPVGPGAREPALFADEDGRVLLSWTEPAEAGGAVWLAVLDGDAWGEPRLVHASQKIFVNWADFPKVAAFADGTVAVNWMTESGSSGYDYDLAVGLSADDGLTWGDPVIPHDDGTTSQHGFVSMLPVAGNRLALVWLDGRGYGQPSGAASQGSPSDAMQLRANTLSTNGRLSGDTLVDIQTCSCCQTSAAVATDDAVLVAYRDRTDAEIRDISVARFDGSTWTEPVTVHPDGWEISGCPVNGPAIDASGDDVAVAWFTGAGNVSAVKVAFSDDAGRSFDHVHRIDSGDAAGRVDAIMLDDGSALLSWVEWKGSAEILYLCRASAANGCEATESLIVSVADGTMGFPQMARSGRDIYVAWTQPLDGGEAEATVRVLRARLADVVAE